MVIFLQLIILNFLALSFGGDAKLPDSTILSGNFFLFFNIFKESADSSVSIPLQYLPFHLWVISTMIFFTIFFHQIVVWE